MRLSRLAAFAFLGSALVALPAAAQSARTIHWSELAPKAALFEDPFEKLSREQLFALADVAGVRDRRARGDKGLTAEELAREQASARKLAAEGVDVDGLLLKRKEIVARRKAQSEAVNTVLNGQDVRLPGYLLPLEISGKKITEFLLVPWVGACIHTPPPPPNQIVHVRLDRPYEMGGLFTPVWVTGRLTAGAVTRQLTLVDGSADIEVGYSIRSATVDAYKE